MMSWNLSWAHSHPEEVIDGFCRVVVRNCHSRLVASWTLMSASMFSWDIG
jgi:hypothetical protein